MVISKEDAPVKVLAHKAKAAAAAMASTPDNMRISALANIACQIRKNKQEILQANQKDVAAAKDLVKNGAISQSMADRLHMDEFKLEAVCTGIEQIAALGDPVGKVDLARELDHDLQLFRITCPIGVVGVIFEARPDALPQIAALCLRSANAVILKGGAEAENSNRALFACIKKAATESGLPGDALVLLSSRSEVAELLQAHQYVDLIIPRGSSALVKHIQENTDIPVLGHAEGICHIYVDEAADLDKANRIICDAKAQYPAACNSVETVLVHKNVAAAFLPILAGSLSKLHVKIRCDSKTAKHLNPNFTFELMSPEQWSTEYGDLVLAIKTVDDLDEAIAHINEHGSNHTEAMITENLPSFDKFFAQVNSAGIFLNASTRFADGFRYGFGAEVGISTGKMHPRGPVGIEGLVTYKYKLVGKGQIVADYVGKDAKAFLHKNI